METLRPLLRVVRGTHFYRRLSIATIYAFEHVSNSANSYLALSTSVERQRGFCGEAGGTDHRPRLRCVRVLSVQGKRSCFTSRCFTGLAYFSFRVSTYTSDVLGGATRHKRAPKQPRLSTTLKIHNLTKGTFSNPLKSIHSNWILSIIEREK
jgi:hypothetical protein